MMQLSGGMKEVNPTNPLPSTDQTLKSPTTAMMMTTKDMVEELQLDPTYFNWNTEDELTIMPSTEAEISLCSGMEHWLNNKCSPQHGSETNSYYHHHQSNAKENWEEEESMTLTDTLIPVDAPPQISTTIPIGNVEVAQLAEEYSTEKTSKKRKRTAKESSIFLDQSTNPEPKKRRVRFDKGEVKSMEYASQQERINKWKQEERKKARKEKERKWREKWKEVKEELELEEKGDGTISKELYYRMGEIFVNSKTCRMEVTRYRRRVASRIYLLYKDSKEFDDGVRIREIERNLEKDLERLARKTWVSKILEGEAVTASRVADAIEASHMVKSSSAVKQNPQSI
jgi:hypothetical protein